MATKSGIYQAVVIGVSAGGITALEKILTAFPADWRPPILIVQHMAPGGGDYLVEHFASRCRLKVCEAMDKERIETGRVYFAPADYHLLVEQQKTLALSTEAKVRYARPAIDVLFATAAEAYCETLVGVVLTGANDDGAAGLARVKALGGLTVVQSPASAEVDVMPRAAMAATRVDHILDLDEIGPFLVSLAKDEEV